MKQQLKVLLLCWTIAFAFPKIVDAQLSLGSFGPTFAVDGEFNEWTAEHLVATDPAGDAVASFDVTNVSAAAIGNTLHLQFELDQIINLQAGPGEDGTLQLLLSHGEDQLTVDYRARTVTDGSTEHLGWGNVGFQSLPTYATDQYEMMIKLDTLKVNVGDMISLDFAGSDSLDQPVSIEVQPSPYVRRRIRGWNKPEGTVRVASQNTLNNGLADTQRSTQFARMIASVDADVYCFQEEWDQQLFDLGVAATLPADFTTYWSNGIAIATRYDLTPLPMVLDRAAAALITTDNDEDVVVISVHFSCCGFAGSFEDNLRIEQALLVVDALNLMRQGEYGVRAQNAPVVLIGDYNLVGSRTPLDILNAIGLDDTVCRSSESSGYTWRSLFASSSFWPGRLDLVSSDGFASVSGRILDTGQMTNRELQQLGVLSTDSLASDHLMLVADCRLVEE